MRVIKIVLLLGVVTAGVIFAWLIYDLPSLDNIKPLELKPSITILAADGSLVARYGGMKGVTVALKSLPRHVPQAVLAIEDRRFYHHPGIDVLGLGRAMLVNARAGRWVQGGSTITQQLAKNLFLTPDKTLRRKGQEALMALMIERHMTKDQILEAYLNRVYFGAGAYGIDAAARTYFGKPATALDLWESAVLAGLLKAPARFSPQASPARARDRAKTVIAAMEAAGYLDIKKKKIATKKSRRPFSGEKENNSKHYFADWIVSQLDTILEEEDTTGIDLVVRTTLQPRLQKMADQVSQGFFKTLKAQDQISQIALVTLGKDGRVLAMIGGKNYNESQFNRATQATRQPGSAFKPFVYLAALEAGYMPESMILDAPFTTGKYRPENYDHQYYGAVPLWQALALSLNTSTVRLLSDIGVNRLANVAKRAGFGSDIPPELSSALGTQETTLLKLANAYAIIANGGQAVWPYAILGIEDGHGTIIFRREGAEFSQVFDSHDTSLLDGMLQQVVAQGTGQAAQLSRGHVAGKTGTTQNYRDAWFVGYTDRLVTGIWMGNDDGTPMNKISGGKYPARLWRTYMNSAIDIDVPNFNNTRPILPRLPFENAFSRLIQQWSQGMDNESNTSRTPEIPIYNQ